MFSALNSLLHWRLRHGTCAAHGLQAVDLSDRISRNQPSGLMHLFPTVQTGALTRERSIFQWVIEIGERYSNERDR